MGPGGGLGDFGTKRYLLAGGANRIGCTVVWRCLGLVLAGLLQGLDEEPCTLVCGWREELLTGGGHLKECENLGGRSRGGSYLTVLGPVADGRKAGLRGVRGPCVCCVARWAGERSCRKVRWGSPSLRIMELEKLRFSVWLPRSSKNPKGDTMGSKTGRGEWFRGVRSLWCLSGCAVLWDMMKGEGLDPERTHGGAVVGWGPGGAGELHGPGRWGDLREEVDKRWGCGPGGATGV
ncbi:hypothetical protein Tco_0550228 [Tanacetum coccineum]